MTFSNRFPPCRPSDQILPLPNSEELGSSTCRSHHHHCRRPQKANQRGYMTFLTHLSVEIQKQSAFKPFRSVDYDTLKIYVKAHGFKVRPLFATTDKTQNLIINMDHEDWTLKDEQTLQEAGCGKFHSSISL